MTPKHKITDTLMTLCSAGWEQIVLSNSSPLCKAFAGALAKHLCKHLNLGGVPWQRFLRALAVLYKHQNRTGLHLEMIPAGSIVRRLV
jgi:hypothetical protein